MNILAVIGSPRKQGNTDLVIEQILAGAREKAHECEKIYLYDYEIYSCIDCRNCKKGDYVCTIEDDMKELYPRIDNTDLIVFGTPL